MIILFLFGYFRQLMSLARLEIFFITAVFCIKYSSLLTWVILPLPIMCGIVTVSLSRQIGTATSVHYLIFIIQGVLKMPENIFL